MELPKNLELLPKYDAPSSWWEHVPIAHWIVETLKPKFIVELGTHYGVSFFSFCEAAEAFSPNTFVYAIDTWEGDSQAGYYGNEVYNSVNEHFNLNHKTRGRLIRSSFDDAAEHFENNSIDIIHIDGLHTYDAVKHDYNTWINKLKDNGSIIFHDCNVREADFGVWKLWQEIKEEGNMQCIETMNGHGLAIATKGTNKPVWHIELIDILPVLKTKGWLLDELRRTKEKLSQAYQKNEKVMQRAELLERNSHELIATIQAKEKELEPYRKGRLYRIISKVKRIINKVITKKNS
jgi:hypothetical protein